MLIVLKPAADSRLMQIAVESNPFLIGRNSEPFSRYPDSVVTTLSKLHARLFATNGRLYLIDRKSRNGTLCNGKSIGRTPVELKTSDMLSFGELRYEVIIAKLPPWQPKVAHRGMRLLLIPENANAGLSPVLVTHFPFNIGKRNQMFANATQERFKPLTMLSKLHAHVFEDRGRFFVEDLGSTNGTFFNSEKLKNRAQRLESGSLITFGHQQICYRAYPLAAADRGVTSLPARFTKEVRASDLILMAAHALQADIEGHTSEHPAGDGNNRSAKNTRSLLSIPVLTKHFQKVLSRLGR